MAIFDERFIKGMQSDNPWWSGNSLRDVPEFKRSDYNHYCEELVHPRINVLLGPRRCGKTTLIYQIIQHLLYSKRADPRRILFISLERPFFELRDQKLQDAIAFYEEKVLGRSLQDSQEMVYIFIDEAHYDSMWSRVLKQYSDQKLPVYVIVSGSSAEAIYHDQESGAGRFHVHQMVTMKFRDALRLRDPANEKKYSKMSFGLRAGILSSFKNMHIRDYEEVVDRMHTLPNAEVDTIKRCYSEYLLKGGYPEFYTKPWSDVSRYYQTNVFDVILQKDVVRIAKPRLPEKVRTLLVLIAENTSRSMTREKIASRLGMQSPLTVDQYLEALTIAFLARTSQKFRVGGGYPSTSPRKYYAADTGLRNAVLGVENIESTQEEGALLETVIFNHSLRLLFHVDRQIRTQGNYWAGDGERDIILDIRRKHGICVPIEVKNGHCDKEDMHKMRVTIKDIAAPFGIIICSNRIGSEGNIMMLPPWIFLLSC
jgi:uncharacterized protein